MSGSIRQQFSQSSASKEANAHQRRNDAGPPIYQKGEKVLGKGSGPYKGWYEGTITSTRYANQECQYMIEFDQTPGKEYPRGSHQLKKLHHEKNVRPTRNKQKVTRRTKFIPQLPAIGGPYPKLMFEENQIRSIRGIPTDIWVLHRWNEIFGDEEGQYYLTDWEGGKTGEFRLDSDLAKKLCQKNARKHDYCQKMRHWFNLLMSGDLTEESGWQDGIQFIENFLFFVTRSDVGWAEVQQQGGGDWASSWSFGGSLGGWGQWRRTTLLENRGQAKHRGEGQWYNTPNVECMASTWMLTDQVRTPYTSLRLRVLDGGHGYNGPREILLSEIFQS